MVVRVGSTADLADLQNTIGSTEIIVNRSLSSNVSVQTFSSGATAIEIKDYYGSKSEICGGVVVVDGGGGVDDRADCVAEQRLVQVAIVVVVGGGGNRFVSVVAS